MFLIFDCEISRLAFLNKRTKSFFKKNSKMIEKLEKQIHSYISYIYINKNERPKYNYIDIIIISERLNQI